MQRVIDGAEWRWAFISSALLVLMISIPFIWAYAAAVPAHHFMGFLVNPIDGYSYLAKMQQGFAGNWLFTLPYTPEPHQGVFLFTFYLALGHLARTLGVPTVLVLHTVRLVGGMYMLLMLYLFVSDWTDDVAQRRIMWGLAAAGSGLGWLAMAVGYVGPDHLTPDLSVPEAFPLYAAYANPHFPWAIALIAWMAHAFARVLLVEDTSPDISATSVGLAGATLGLVSISPFGLVPLGCGVAAVIIWKWWRARRFPWREAAWASIVPIFGLPLAAYNAWAISAANPVFRGWMLQNVTPSPPVWDYLIAYGPLLIMAGIALWALRRQLDEGDVFLLAWMGINMLLLYAPLGLQRRFSMGLILPMAVYAGCALWRVILPLVVHRWRPVLLTAILAVSVLTTLMVIVVPVYGVMTLNEGLYATLDEYRTLLWLDTHTKPDALILAAPDYSLMIPALTGRRVVYAHPFETLRAQERRESVLAFYAGVDCSVVEAEDVDYIVIGLRERRIRDELSGDLSCLPDEAPLHQIGQIEVYTAP